MAHSDKNIVITPFIGSSTNEPQIVFSGANASLGPQNITLRVYPTNSGTVSFEGTLGAIFQIANTGTGRVSVLSITTATTSATGSLQVAGGVGIGDSVYVGNRVGWSDTTNVSKVYQFYNTVTNSLDTVFG